MLSQYWTNKSYLKKVKIRKKWESEKERGRTDRKIKFFFFLFKAYPMAANPAVPAHDESEGMVKMLAMTARSTATNMMARPIMRSTRRATLTDLSWRSAVKPPRAIPSKPGSNCLMKHSSHAHSGRNVLKQVLYSKLGRRCWKWNV